jgi:hypothetical protein
VLYIKNQFVLHTKHFTYTTVTKTNQLMTYTAQAAVCSEIRTKHSAQRENHVQFWVLKLVVRKEPAMLWKVKAGFINCSGLAVGLREHTL